jgi:hypothetical protein
MLCGGGGEEGGNVSGSLPPCFTVFFIQDRFYTGQSLYRTNLIRGQSLYEDKVYTGTKFIRDKVYTVTKFIRGQSLYKLFSSALELKDLK